MEQFFYIRWFDKFVGQFHIAFILNVSIMMLLLISDTTEIYYYLIIKKKERNIIDNNYFNH